MMSNCLTNHRMNGSFVGDNGVELTQIRQSSERRLSELSVDDVDHCDSQSSGVAPASHRSSSHRLVTLLVIVILFIANQTCRALPFFMVDFSKHGNDYTAMNKNLNFGTGKYGILATIGFTLPFFFGSFASGVLADKMDRIRISVFAGIVWSACTLCMAFATNYWQVLALRAVLGLSQSVTNPAAISLLGEDFPDARATVASVFGLGIYVGGGLANIAVGLDNHLGWRDTSVAFGAGSLLLSFVTLLARDSHRQHQEEGNERRQSLLMSCECDESDHSHTLTTQGVGMFAKMHQWYANGASITSQIIQRNIRACSSTAAKWLLLAALSRFCAGFSIMVWLAAAIKVRYPNKLAHFAVFNTLIKVFGGGTASLVGGVIADLLKKHGWGDKSSPLLCAVVSAVAAPIWHMVLAENIKFEACMFLLLMQYLMAETWLGPAIATLQQAVPKERRGAAQGVFTASTALGNLMPACLGLFGPETIVIGLQASVTSCYLFSAGCFFVVALCMPHTELEEPPL